MVKASCSLASSLTNQRYSKFCLRLDAAHAESEAYPRKKRMAHALKASERRSGR